MTFNINEAQSILSTMNDEIEALRKVYQEKVKTMLTTVTDEFFETTPEISAIHWTQYTPHFMDGDECIFGVNEIYYNVNRKMVPRSTSDWDPEETEDDDYEEEYDYEGDQFYGDVRKDVATNIVRISKAISVFETTNEITIDNTWPLGYYCYDRNVFSISKTKNYLRTLTNELASIDKEIADYPNRDQAIENFNQIKKFFSSIDSDIMKEIFGDHVKVVITKKGIDVQEYEHD